MFAAASQWYKQPYQDNMSVTKWFLFTGLLIVIGMVWSIIIHTMTD